MPGAVASCLPAEAIHNRVLRCFARCKKSDVVIVIGCVVCVTVEDVCQTIAFFVRMTVLGFFRFMLSGNGRQGKWVVRRRMEIRRKPKRKRQRHHQGAMDSDFCPTRHLCPFALAINLLHLLYPPQGDIYFI